MKILENLRELGDVYNLVRGVKLYRDQQIRELKRGVSSKQPYSHDVCYYA
jgi:hypothetical protein